MSAGHRSSRLLAVYVGVLIIFLFAPLILLVLFSFHRSASLAFPFEGFSLRWYRDLGATTDTQDAIWTSVKLALIASVTSTVAGTMAALAFTRHRPRGSGVARALILSPAALPELVIGVALLAVFLELGLQLSLWTAAVGHALYTMPFVYLVAYSRLSRTDPLLEQAARDLGATPWQAFRRVTFPAVAPAMLGGMMVAIALSWDEFFISVFTIGNQPTVPVLIWTKIRRTIDPSVNAISAGLLVATILMVIGGTLISRRRAA